MIASADSDALEARLATLEARLQRLELRSAATLGRSHAAGAPVRSGARPREQQPAREQAPGRWMQSRTASGMSIGDLLGGRVLAWLGGAATLLGIVLLLALAISHGWIGENARVLLAAGASAALMALGAWLHAHRGKTDAASVMVGTATAGLFATLIVASDAYGVLSVSLAVPGALLLCALAIWLATRWAGRARWLALLGVLMCVPQWAAWVASGQPPLLDVLVLVGFAALGLGGALGVQLRASEERMVACSAALLTLSACVAALIGRVALADAAGPGAGDLWVASLAVLYVGCGMWRAQRIRISLPLRKLLIALGVTFGDVAFAFSAHGATLAIGWSATAVALAWLVRRSAPERAGEALVGVGVSAQIALALIAVLLDAPPSALGGGHVQLLGLLSISALAASCIACGRFSPVERGRWRIALDGLGLLAIAYLSASALGGAALVVAWAFEGLALARLSARSDDALTRVGALAFVIGAALHVLSVEASPATLITGASDLGAAALALGALAIVGLRVGSSQPAGSATRRWSLIAAAGCALYFVSVAIVTVFQPASGALGAAVLDLGVAQQGQVLLSAVWSLVGVGALIAGLRGNIPQLRSAGLALLLVAVGKVFLYDLSTLTSVYRVVSFIVLGLLLLAGAFAYQRLRPPPRPDMRAMHPSQR